MKGKLLKLLDTTRFFLKILRWREYWIVMAAAGSVVVFWGIFCLALSLPNPWRSIIMYGIIFGSAALSARR